MEKPATLMGDLPELHLMYRKMDAASREKYRAIRERKNQRLKGGPKVFYIKKNGGVTGTSLLSQAAIYPTRFCSALVKIWKKTQDANAV